MAAIPLGLAPDAPGGLRPGVEAPLGNRGAAVSAHAIGPVVDSPERLGHQAPLRLRGRENRLRPVGLRQYGSRVRRILWRVRTRAAAGCSPRSTRMDRSMLAAHLLETLSQRWQCPRGLPPFSAGRRSRNRLAEPPRCCCRSQNNESGAESEGRCRSLVLVEAGAGGGPAARAAVSPGPHRPAPSPPVSGAIGVIRPGPLLRT